MKSAIKISPNLFLDVKRLEKLSEKTLARAWCELNAWRTPACIRKQMNRNLERDEISEVMKLVSSLTTRENCDREWQRFCREESGEGDSEK